MHPIPSQYSPSSMCNIKLVTHNEDPFCLTRRRLRTEKNKKAEQSSNPRSVVRRNERERNRIRVINSTFVSLRQCLPSEGRKRRRMSKVDVLRNAASYIHCLRQLLVDYDHNLQSLCGPTGWNAAVTPLTQQILAQNAQYPSTLYSAFPPAFCNNFPAADLYPHSDYSGSDNYLSSDASDFGSALSSPSNPALVQLDTLDDVFVNDFPM